MSDLEKRIDQWRTGLAGSDALSSTDLNELESHLREEMEHLKTTGLSDEEAFLIGRRRLGDAAALAEEFAKVNPSRRRVNHRGWMVLGVLTCLVSLQFGAAASQVALAVTQGMDLSPRVLAFLAGTVRISAFGAVGVLIMWLCHQHLRPGRPPQVHPAKRVRMAFLLGLFLETLGFCITNRFFYIPVPAFRSMTPPLNYGHIVTPPSGAWWLLGVALLGVLFLALYWAGRRIGDTRSLLESGLL